MLRKCYLYCLLNSHAPILLEHGVDTIVGRNLLTKIKDQSCSRQQLSLKPDCEECTVEVKQIGINPSGLDGFSMSKDCAYKVYHGARIEILLNNHIHVIRFEPEPESFTTRNIKRKLDDSKFEVMSKVLKRDTYSTPNEENVWEEIDNGELYVFTAKGVRSSKKIAAFDMDGTLITTKSGKVYPVDLNDWKIAFPNVSEKLKEHVTKDFKIIILSNQAPIGNGKVKIEDFKKKIEAIVEKLDVPIQAFIATGKGLYRKPGTGMWQVLVKQKNDKIKIDMENSFYCGDAAGRVANWAPGKKKDHSMADKLMAENLGLTFYTPEQFFLGHSVKNVPMSKPEFNPKELPSESFNNNLISKEKEILVLVGFPGSGKSFLAREIEERSNGKYKIVCRDQLGAWQKCISEATKLLQQGKSVIVDSTNPDLESRARWTSLARDNDVPARCAKMAATFAHAKHNNKFRELVKEKHVPVSDIVFHSYKNKFVEPTTKEGFREVIPVKFSACFKSSEHEDLYRMHLLEK